MLTRYKVPTDVVYVYQTIKKNKHNICAETQLKIVVIYKLDIKEDDVQGSPYQGTLQNSSGILFDHKKVIKLQLKNKE